LLLVMLTLLKVGELYMPCCRSCLKPKEQSNSQVKNLARRRCPLAHIGSRMSLEGVLQHLRATPAKPHTSNLCQLHQLLKHCHTRFIDEQFGNTGFT
jgi:hypothetical protein